MGIISRTDLRMRLDSKVTLLKIPSFVTTNFDHKLSSKSGALGINPVRPQTLAVGSAGHVLLYDLRNPKFCEQEDGPGSRIRPVNYPHEVYGCGTMDSFNITSIDFNHKNEMLVNYMNHAPLVYGLNIPKAKVQCVQNAQSMQMFLEFVSHSYPELRANRAAKKKAEKKELREMRKAQKKSGNTENDGDVKTPKPSPHCPQVQVMKTKANELFVHEQYSAAIDIYSLAINLEPHPILYSNRALALKKRALPGDTYHSMLDCVSALKLDPLFHKCHFRMMDCMLSIDFPPTTIYKCLKDYRKLHPERADEDSVFLDLWNKVKARLHKGQKDMTMDEGDLCFDDNYDLIDGFGWSFSGGELVRTETTKKYKRNEGPPKTVVNQHAPLPVRTWRESFHGRSHADTMIKNACFIGESIIATGTDTGHVFFYDRPTQQLINIFRADSHIVNIVEPHPIDPLSAVAVSGIDDSIKLYTPYPSKVSSENDYKLSKMHQKYEIVNENVRHLEGSMHPAAQFGCTNQ